MGVFCFLWFVSQIEADDVSCFFQVKASELEKSVWCHSNNMYMFYLHFKGLTSPNGDTTKGVDLQYTGNPSRVCITFCPVTGGIGSWFG